MVELWRVKLGALALTASFRSPLFLLQSIKIYSEGNISIPKQGDVTHLRFFFFHLTAFTCAT